MVSVSYETLTQWRHLIKTMMFMENTTISDGLIYSFMLPEFSFLKDVLHLDYFVEIIRGLGDGKYGNVSSRDYEEK